jgi:hypothetical protein
MSSTRPKANQTMRAPLCWQQVRNVYLVIAPIVVVILYFSRHDINDWVRLDALNRPSHLSLQAENSNLPVELPLSSKDAAATCGQVLKLEKTAFKKLDIVNRLATVVADAGFTQQEIKDLDDSEKNLEEQAFKAYSFAYLTWDKPTEESRADFDKMITKVFNSLDVQTLSSDERAKVEAYAVKVKSMMLHAFELGRHDARISPCPV